MSTELRLHGRTGRTTDIDNRSAAANRDADHHRRQLVHGSARRNFLDDVFGDCARHRRTLHIDERSFGSNLDGFGDAADLQFRVHLGREVGKHFDAVMFGRGEAGQGEGHAVGARRKTYYRVLT